MSNNEVSQSSGQHSRRKSGPRNSNPTPSDDNLERNALPTGNSVNIGVESQQPARHPSFATSVSKKIKEMSTPVESHYRPNRGIPQISPFPPASPFNVEGITLRVNDSGKGQELDNRNSSSMHKNNIMKQQGTKHKCKFFVSATLFPPGIPQNLFILNSFHTSTNKSCRQRWTFFRSPTDYTTRIRPTELE